MNKAIFFWVSARALHLRILVVAVALSAAAHAAATVETVGPNTAVYGAVDWVSEDGATFFSFYNRGLRHRWTTASLVPITTPAKVNDDFALNPSWGEPRVAQHFFVPDGSAFIAHYWSPVPSAGNFDPLAHYTANGGDYFLWTMTNGWQSLPFLASGISSTGRMIGRRAYLAGGQSRTAGVYADADLVTHDLARVNAANICEPQFISADGQVIVGREYPQGGGTSTYVRWVGGQAPTSLNAFGASTAAMGILGSSADAMTLVGTWMNDPSRLPLRWRIGAAPETLATLATRAAGYNRGGYVRRATVGGDLCLGSSSGYGPSVDLFVPGRSSLGSDGLVVWNRAGACRPLDDLLLEEGLDVRGMFQGGSELSIASAGGAVTLYANGFDFPATTISCKKVVFPDPNQGAPAPLAGGTMLDSAANFVPMIRVTESYAESTKAAPYPAGYTRTWRGKSAFTITASMAGIDPATLGPDTPVSFQVGDWGFSGTLGDDPKYKPKATAAKFSFRKVVNGKTLTVGTVALKWSGVTLSVKGSVTDPGFQSIALHRYASWEGPARGWIPVQIGFAGHSGKRDAVWLTGKNVMTMRKVAANLGNGYLEQGYLRVPSLKLSGSESIPPLF